MLLTFTVCPLDREPTILELVAEGADLTFSLETFTVYVVPLEEACSLFLWLVVFWLTT